MRSDGAGLSRLFLSADWLATDSFVAELQSWSNLQRLAEAGPQQLRDEEPTLQKVFLLKPGCADPGRGYLAGISCRPGTPRGPRHPAR